MSMRGMLLAFAAASAAAGPLQTGGRAPDPGSPEGVVFRLYRDYAWEAVMAGSFSDGLLEQPRGVLERYFDGTLASLILKDRACADEKGMCRLDFDPIWDSQDPAAGDLTVEKAGEPDAVSVTFRRPGGAEKTELTYRVIETARGWRISDISGRDWSLVSILSGPEPE